MTSKASTPVDLQPDPHAPAAEVLDPARPELGVGLPLNELRIDGAVGAPFPGATVLPPGVAATPAGHPGAAPVAKQPVVDARVLMANERTFLAWVRTAIGFMAFGFVISRAGLWVESLGGEQVAHSGGMRWLGIGMVFVGVLSIVLSWIGYHRTRTLLLSGEEHLPPSPGIALLTALLIAAGVAMTALLSAPGG